MNLLTIKRACVNFCVNHIFAGTKFFEIKRKLLLTIGHEIGENTKIVAPIYCTGTLKIGGNCWIGKNFSVYGNGRVIIGKNCDVAPEVSLHTGGHEIGGASRRAGKGCNCDIVIGDGVWLGARSTILRQTTIGDGCVVAACACVVQDIPCNMLVGGVPARVIRELSDETASIVGK